jgi:hypothetical protein
VVKSLEFFLRFTCVNIELNSGTPWYTIFRAHGRIILFHLHYCSLKNSGGFVRSFIICGLKTMEHK